jgi:hypothetical protein
MRNTITLIFLGLLLTGCGRHDAQLQKAITGSWSDGFFFKITLAPDGSWESQWARPTNGLTYLTYQGTWAVKDGLLVSTLTNCVAVGTTNFVPVGNVQRCKIVQADDSNFVYVADAQTISLKRR